METMEIQWKNNGNSMEDNGNPIRKIMEKEAVMGNMGNSWEKFGKIMGNQKRKIIPTIKTRIHGK